MDRIITILFLLAISFFFSCTNRKDYRNEFSHEKNTDPIEVVYAKNFKLSKSDSALFARVISPWPGSSDTLAYEISLAEPGIKRDGIPGKRKISQIGPEGKVVCFSTSHIPLLDMLGVADQIIGFPTTDYISNEHVRARID